MTLSSVGDPRGRVRRLLASARRLAEPEGDFGRQARAQLVAATGLSPQGVDLALTHSLEHTVADADLERLCGYVRPAPRAHVLLSANAFVGALRAIALALASSPDVLVRPSRRETAMAALLLEGAPGLFQLVTELVPAPGEHLWAYGTARTLESLRHELPSGVVLHPHGPGIGLVALDLQAHPEETSNWAEGLALDTVLLDQRGCLSPRIVALRGTVEACQRFAASLAAKLSRWEHDCPRGSLSALERGEELRYRDTLLYAGDVLPAGKGGLGLQFDGTGTLVLPPAARWLHLLRADDPLRTLEPLAPHATTLALGGLAASELERGPFRHTRLTLPGSMQRPRFDGPVDKRGASEGEVL